MYTETVPTKIDQSTILRNVYFYGIDELCIGLVLTPTCDFAQNKVELVQVCALIPAWDFIREMLQTDWKNFNSDKKIKDIQGKVKELIRLRFPRYHWFAPLPNTTIPLIGDFQNVTSLPFLELEKLEIIAELISPYREQVPARYAAYMGRVGTPDFSDNNIQEWLEASVKTLFPTS